MILRRATLTLALLAPSCAANEVARHNDVEVATAATQSAEVRREEAHPPVTITVRPPVVGDRFEHASDTELAGEEMTETGVRRFRQVRNLRFATEILAVRDGRVVKQRVRYRIFKRHDEPPPDVRLEKAPVLGKGYVLERTDRGLDVSDESGALLTVGEGDYMHETWADFGTPTKTSRVLAAAPRGVGDSFPDLAAAYAADASEGDLLFSGESVRLKARRGDIAVFEYVLDGRSEGLEGAVIKRSGIREVSISTGDVTKDRAVLTMDGGAPASFKLRGTTDELLRRL